MRPEIDAYLTVRGHVASREQLLRLVTRNQFDHEVAAGHLVAPFPRVYCRPWDLDDDEVRQRAALLSVRRPAVLSHLTALRRWGLTVPDAGGIHLTVPIGRHPHSSAPGLVVHRTRIRSTARTVGGLLTIDPAYAVTQSWPLMAGPDQRGPAIEAVRNGIVTPARLRRAAEHAVGLRGRSRLIRLTGLLDAGCRSELEIWGYLGVFAVPALAHAKRQRVIHVGGRTYWLDLAYEREQVAVELDGERYHSTPSQREKDRRRDALLATLDWVTLRFSHDRLHHDAAGCRRDTLATLAARRARFAA